MSKYELIKYFDEMGNDNNVLKNKLFNLIVANGWLEYYLNNFPDEFGLY